MKLLAALRNSLIESQTQEIQDLLREIDRLRERCETLSPEQFQMGLQKLAPLRVRSSGTLRGGAHQAWIDANSYVSLKMQEGCSLDWQQILHLNHLFTARDPRHLIRTQEIYIGPFQACQASKLESTLQLFQEEILNRHTARLAPLQAALLQYWLVSIHPFWDANGRTSILASDWVLASGGYLPQCFEKSTDAVVGFFDGKFEQAHATRGLTKILINIRRSYEICLSAAP